MIAILSSRIADYLINRRIVDAEDKDIYIYGAQLFLLDVINLGSIALIGLISNRIIYSLIFLLCFIPMRRFCGGYHASSHFRCWLATVSVFAIILVSTAIFPLNYTYFIIIMNISSCLVFIEFAPVENPNKPLSEKSRQKNHLRAVWTGGIWAVVAMALYASKQAAGVLISVTLFIIALLVVIEIQKRRDVRCGKKC